MACLQGAATHPARPAHTSNTAATPELFRAAAKGNDAILAVSGEGI
jgi:hypothetical protein